MNADVLESATGIKEDRLFDSSHTQLQWLATKTYCLGGWMFRISS